MGEHFLRRYFLHQYSDKICNAISPLLLIMAIMLVGCTADNKTPNGEKGVKKLLTTIIAGKTGTVRKWDVLEIEAKGFSDKNPFTDYQIVGTFTSASKSVTVDGFYDGDGVYKVRFMPSIEGEYRYEISGSFAEKPQSGSFTVTPPKEGVHGRVRVADKYHFAYEDGTPFYPIGTTCYAWTHQTPEMQEQTIEELKKGYFNKIRFCVFPKHYVYNFREPQAYPYEGTPMDNSKVTVENFEHYFNHHEENNWNFKRFNPVYFQLFEKRIEDMAELGIEADLIVMHCYDRWGFSNMSAEDDDLYWKYIVARFAAFRNVWWSLANEFDLLETKTIDDWERYAKILCEKDPYDHLRSIHNGRVFYDHNKPWVTHCSIQNPEGERTTQWREQYGKPTVFDEMVYEGNIKEGWGRISGTELTRRFWECAVRGGYGGHGETFLHPDDILWWSHGGKLHGESPERIKFLLNILYETLGLGLKQYVSGGGDTAVFRGKGTVAVPEKEMPIGSYCLIYFGNANPSFYECKLDDSANYEVEVIDTWDMTIQKLGVMNGKMRIELPEKQFMAIRIRKV
jgi:hypothetical protein